MLEPRSLSALLIDDDPVLLGLLSYRLQRAVLGLAISTAVQPQAVPGHDIYIIDNDFGGNHSGARLAEHVRLHAPDALILVFSSFLDVPLLKRVTNVGTDGVFDKSEPADMERLLETVAQWCEQARNPVPLARQGGGILSEISAMLFAWNRKLTREENARAAD